MKICELKRGEEISDMKEIRAIALDILSDFDAFCKEHNLKYCLTQGTLLGAIRHKGFIPWDDDIDISMFRPDYDRLIELADEMPESCKFFSRENLSYHSRLYGRICNTDYVSVDSYYSEKTCGYFGLDLFPIEPVPTEDGEYNAFAKKIKLLRQMFIFSNSALFKGDGFLRAFIIKPLPILLCKLIGAKRIYKWYNNLIHKLDFEKAESLALVCAVYTDKEKFPKSDYLDLIEVEFEGMKFPAVRNYDVYLKHLYNDYMKLPPKEKQVAHHSFRIFKINK